MVDHAISLQASRPAWPGWAAASALALAAGVSALALSPVESMWAMVLALFLGFKLVTLPRRRPLQYLFLWVGLDPRPFDEERRPDPAGSHLILRALPKIALGAALAAFHPLLAIPGFLLAVHMGLFDALAGVWRMYGLPVERICPEPWLSRSIGEFWGTRWNMAFHAFVRDRVYRPIARRSGRTGAVWAVFFFSGLVHELVVSLPGRGGWGLPTLYFLLQGLAVLLERRGILRPTRWTTAAIVLLPLPLLAHPWFLRNVILA